MIRNLNIHHVSPQFPVMYDDFLRLCIVCEGVLHYQKFFGRRLYTFNRSHVDWDIEPPDLAVVWLSLGERFARREKQQEFHRVPSVPREPSAQREPVGTTEGASPAVAQEDVQTPLVDEAPALSLQQPPAQAASPAGSSLSPISIRQSSGVQEVWPYQRLTYEVKC